MCGAYFPARPKEHKTKNKTIRVVHRRTGRAARCATVAIVGAIVLLAADLRNVESHAPLQEIDMQQKEDGNEPPRGIGVEMVEVGINGNAVGRGIG